MKPYFIILPLALFFLPACAHNDWDVIGSIYDFEQVALDRFKPSSNVRLFVGKYRRDLYGDQNLRIRSIDGGKPTLQYVMNPSRESGGAIIIPGHHIISVAVRGRQSANAGGEDANRQLEFTAEIGKVYLLQMVSNTPTIIVENENSSHQRSS